MRKTNSNHCHQVYCYTCLYEALRKQQQRQQRRRQRRFVDYNNTNSLSQEQQQQHGETMFVDDNGRIHGAHRVVLTWK